jgi:hypothetical protein
VPAHPLRKQTNKAEFVFSDWGGDGEVVTSIQSKMRQPMVNVCPRHADSK